MAVDTPAKIAVIGAGPVGLEAALYARYLGYDVDLYEQQRVCERLQQAAHVRAFEPWRACTTSLGRASLTNQDPKWRPAADDALLSYGELIERYFLPLAGCDLLADCVQTDGYVVALGREGLHREDFLQDERRIDVPFRLIVVDNEGNQRVEHADVVFDCTGLSRHGYIGNGGLPWLGSAAAPDFGDSDILGGARQSFLGKHTLVVGDGLSAARAVVELARLAADDAQTRITWVTRNQPENGVSDIVPEIAGDRVAARAALLRKANELAAQAGGILDVWPATYVETVERTDDDAPYEIEFSGRHAGHATFEMIIPAVAPRPDLMLWREMQLLVCPALEAPLPMAEFLRRQAAEPARDVAARRQALAQALLNPEPDFYVLGSKSWGRRGDEFLFAEAHEQIVALFTILGDRESLDLYATRFPAA